MSLHHLALFTALAGLGVGVWSALRGRRPESGGGQAVTGSTIGGGVTQVRGVGGSVRLGTPDQVPPPAEDRVLPATPRGEAGGAQSVSESRVAGPVRQIDQIGGDVETGR